MARRRFYLPKQNAPVDRTDIMCDVNVNYVPCVLRAIDGIKSAPFWASETEAERGYRELCLFQWGLLMSSGEFIVNNLIALRGIDPAAPRDEVYGTPIAPPEGSTLLDLFSTLQGEAGTPGAALGRITAATEATATATQQGLLVEEGGETVARIAQLALLL